MTATAAGLCTRLARDGVEERRWSGNDDGGDVAGRRGSCYARRDGKGGRGEALR